MSDFYLGEIRYVSLNVVPKGWVQCNGQMLAISTNQALYSLLGTTYGGDGKTTFGLPDLRGRVPIHVGNGFNAGSIGGEAQHMLTTAEMPMHMHMLSVDGSTAATSNANSPSNGNALGASIGHSSQGTDFALNVYNSSLSGGAAVASQMVAGNGGSQPHENRQPYQVVTAIIALTGIFPSRQ